MSQKKHDGKWQEQDKLIIAILQSNLEKLLAHSWVNAISEATNYVNAV